MMKKTFIFSIILSAAFLLQAEVPLMKNGSPQCVIIPAAKDPTSLHAANELALYLGKIGKGTAPAVSDKTVSGKSSVIFSLVKDPAIREHGFSFETKGKTLYIKAVKPVGLLFGAYQLLKDHTGIRWLYPGREGEFYTVKKNITIPDMKKISNPSFKVRTFHFCCANIDFLNKEVYDWMVRNGMNIEMDLFQQKIPLHNDFLAKRGATLRGGWHCFTRLHNGINTAADKKKCLADYEKMFIEHPERFPLINGQRRFLKGQLYQPCTTNQDNIRIIAANLVKEMRQYNMDKIGGRYIMVNNDNTAWCECPACKAVDPKQEVKESMVATRYWTFINAVTALARKEIPDLPAVGYGYQNYQKPPVGVKPDLRLPVMLSYNRKCYRHKLQDPNCEVNRLYYSYYKAWGRMSPGNVTTWEEISNTGTDYQPNELIYAEHLKEYYRLGIRGTTPSIPPLYSKYGPSYKGTMIPECWYAMWQTFYLGAQILWDVNADPVRILEEANAVYYGPAWKNGMQEYRKILTETSLGTPGCFGHGMHAPVGRNLTRPGVEARLTAALARAEKAAANDPRRLEAIRREKRYFNNIWVKQNRMYVKNYRELRAYPKTGTIRIDGKLDEPAWKNTDIIGNYMVTGDKPAVNQTALRMIYEPDYLYVAIEAMEPAMNRIRSVCTKRDGKVWEDNSVELFLNHPDLNNRYFHFIINDKGTLNDAIFDGPKSDNSFDSQAQIAVGKYSDRWIVEMKIPTSMLAMKCFPGHTWRFNSQRYRVVDGEPANESSSLAAGAGHGVNVFLPVSFAAARSVSAGSNQERDSRYWKNADLNAVQTIRISPKSHVEIRDSKIPANWHVAGTSGFLAMESAGKNAGDLCMHLKQIRVYQLHKGKQSKFRIVFDARGKGKMQLAVYRYTRTPRGDSGRHLGTDYPLSLNLTEQWKTYKVDYQKRSAEEVLGIAIHANTGEAWVDNVFVLPMDTEAK